jgi:RNA polymerase sigma-70 factor (ECF subfamily)
LKAQAAGSAATEDARRDVALLERVAARDALAVGELYDRHSRLLYGVILRILRVPSEAEEVLQDVFLVVWNRVDTYDGTLGSPAAWLARIARNRAIDRLRTNAARGRVVASLPAEAPPGDDPESDASMGEQRRAVARALDALAHEQRVLIEEAYYFGFTQSELAERHNLPLGTVKTRIRTGLSALREQLSQLSV